MGIVQWIFINQGGCSRAQMTMQGDDTYLLISYIYYLQISCLQHVRRQLHVLPTYSFTKTSSCYRIMYRQRDKKIESSCISKGLDNEKNKSLLYPFLINPNKFTFIHTEHSQNYNQSYIDLHSWTIYSENMCKSTVTEFVNCQL